MIALGRESITDRVRVRALAAWAIQGDLTEPAFFFELRASDFALVLLIPFAASFAWAAWSGVVLGMVWAMWAVGGSLPKVTNNGTRD